MTYEITLVDEISDPKAMAGIIRQYYGVMVPKLVAMGGPQIDLDDLVADTFRDIPAFFPPTGRVALAHDTDGRLVGCGMMRTCTPDAVELKRLFVLPECQGSGLGRRLVLTRLDEARKMGMKYAFADTLRNNTPMQKLYDAIGFEPCEKYPGNDEYDEIADYVVYRRIAL